VTQMDEATQQNAALVEEAAAATQSMEQQSRVLVDAVAVFRVNADGDAMPATTGAATSPANVTRLPVKSISSGTRAAAPKRTAVPRAANSRPGDDEWEEF